MANADGLTPLHRVSTCTSLSVSVSVGTSACLCISLSVCLFVCPSGPSVFACLWHDLKCRAALGQSWRRGLTRLDKHWIVHVDVAFPLPPQCCIENTKELAELLLEYDGDVDARDIEGWTPLHAACATGNLQMINVLVDHGASLTSTNNDDCMPIDVAADGDIKHVMKQKMLELGVCVCVHACACMHVH